MYKIMTTYDVVFSWWNTAASIPDIREWELKGCKEHYFGLVAMQLVHV